MVSASAALARGLRVVTINTAKSAPPYMERLALLMAGLDDLAPDIVLVQEAFAAADGAAHTARSLARRLGLHLAYAPARRKVRPFAGRGINSESGMAVLSRYRIRDAAAVPLPSDPADGERVAQLVIVDTGPRPVLAANVHLTHLPGRDDLRVQQLAALLAHPWWRGQPHGVRLLGGDFNTPLERVPDLLVAAAGWQVIDGYRAGGGELPRATVPTRLSPDEGRCVDYLLALVQPGEEPPRFDSARLVLGQPGPSGVYPSDHRGVAVRVQLAGRQYDEREQFAPGTARAGGAGDRRGGRADSGVAAAARP